MGLSPLSANELDGVMPTIPDWRLEDGALVRRLRFDSHPAAIAFIVKVSSIAEEMEHHPEILNVWASVTLTLRTHDAGDRVTSLDVMLAREIDALMSSEL